MIGSSETASVRALDLLRQLLGDYSPRDFAVRLWDGTTWPPEAGHDARFTLVVRDPRALRSFLGAPAERALAETYIRDEIDLEGDVLAALPVADHLLVDRDWSRAQALRGAVRLLRLGTNGDRAGDGHEPAILRGRRFSLARDRQAVSYHYDRSNAFFRLWLDERMVYSCAYWPSPEATLEEAQERKLDLVCRKLRLRPGERFLDIGCGWGALIAHAAARYGADALGITLSENQAEEARERIAAAGVENRCRVEVVDYRELSGTGGFDKVASIGMFEHIAEERLSSYFRDVHRLLRPQGAFLNQGISRATAQKPRRGPSFLTSYVYPDAELSPVSSALRAAEEAGFEVRDVESLREHYPLTLRAWLRRLEERHDDVVRATDETTYRVFRLYLAGSAWSFARRRVSVFQVLLVKPDGDGRNGLPLLRSDWYG